MIRNGSMTIAPVARRALSVDQWSGFVSLGVPVITDLNGIQAKPAWRMITGASVAFRGAASVFGEQVR